MEIIDMTEQYTIPYFCCLEEYSQEMKEAGNHKAIWYNKMKKRGLRVKLAVEDNIVCGMIQYTPVEYSIIDGEDLYFINCIWVHGNKEGIGNYQKRGIGKALLQAAEEDVRSLGRKGVVAWGLSLPFWMRAAWYKKHGYRKIENNGIAQLLWKQFSSDALPPKWITPVKKPLKEPEKVIVTSFIHGWCPAFNIVHERAKRAVQKIGFPVEFRVIDTSEKETIREWGIADALFIDDTEIHTGPPLSYEKIVKLISKRVEKCNK